MTDEPTNEPLEPIEPQVPGPSAADTPTVEAPATVAVDATGDASGDGPPPWNGGPEAAATPPVPPKRSGVMVPVWALVTVGGLLIFALGFLGGLAVADNDDAPRAFSPSELRELVPFGPNGQGNSQSPDRWSDGNGNNGNSNDGNGGSTAAGTVYLGVVVQDSSDPAGAEVARVAASSPAEKAGLENGDVITKVDDEEVRTAAALTEEIRDHVPGDEVTITYTRDGASKTVDAELAARPRLGQLPVPDRQPQNPF